MTAIAHRKRQRAGIRTGGQFAPDHRSEPAVSLARQQEALRALGTESLRAPRALGGGTQPALPGMSRTGAGPSAWLLSPAARYRAGEETVTDLIAEHGWTPVAPVEQPDARFTQQAAATNGDQIVQSYVLPGRDTTCLVLLPAHQDGTDPWLDAQFISMQGRAVSVHTVQAATGIVSLDVEEESDAQARRGRLTPADLARHVHDLAA
ncbi:hypothetical protein [Pseudactinotalea terrae]|uniref:hypothetical protein n=1 Tax=Pseudactinotalea terrae TaxID=1743262 RepID=UPI0012E2F15D|nr:hypothetical protein [Pseudactinotalea terrae]